MTSPWPTPVRPELKIIPRSGSVHARSPKPVTHPSKAAACISVALAWYARLQRASQAQQCSGGLIPVVGLLFSAGKPALGPGQIAVAYDLSKF